MAKSGTNGSGKGQFGRIRPENGIPGQTKSVRTGFGTQSNHFMQQQAVFGRGGGPPAAAAAFRGGYTPPASPSHMPASVNGWQRVSKDDNGCLRESRGCQPATDAKGFFTGC